MGFWGARAALARGHLSAETGATRSLGHFHTPLTLFIASSPTMPFRSHLFRSGHLDNSMLLIGPLNLDWSLVDVGMVCL